MPRFPLAPRTLIAGGAGLLLIAALVVVILAQGSGSGQAATTTTTSSSTTTTEPTTTTTTEPTTTTTTQPSALSPLTGLPLTDEELADRRALVIKVDNFPIARPQSGLPHADAVIELSVEGITRLVAIFHQGDSILVGPIRSIRPTDWQIARLLDAPLVISGGQRWVVSRNVDNGANIIGDVGRPYTFRAGTRPAPHNLYGNTFELRALADRRDYPNDPPQPLWEFGDLPRGTEEATRVRLDFTDGLLADWIWDGERYLRETNGVVHEWIDDDGETTQISVEVLVVMEMRTYTMSPPPGAGPAKAVESVGEGRAWVFAGGEVAEGRWSRQDADASFTLTTLDGEALAVPPGSVWISFLPDGKAPAW